MARGVLGLSLPRVFHQQALVLHHPQAGGFGGLGRLSILQLFVNLSGKNKHIAPQVFHTVAGVIPAVLDEAGNRTRVLAGQFGADVSPLAAAEPFDFFDTRLNGPWTWQVPSRRSTLVYVLSGEVTVFAGGQTQVPREHEAVGIRSDAAGAELRLEPKSAAQALVLSGEDPREPIAVYGPFIMNSQAEVAQAYERYHAGQMGRLTPTPD